MNLWGFGMYDLPSEKNVRFGIKYNLESQIGQLTLDNWISTDETPVPASGDKIYNLNSFCHRNIFLKSRIS